MLAERSRLSPVCRPQMSSTFRPGQSAGESIVAALYPARRVSRRGTADRSSDGMPLWLHMRVRRPGYPERSSSRIWLKLTFR